MDHTGRHVRLDLIEVSSVDRAGVAMLRRLSHWGVKIADASPFVRALVEQGEP